MLLFFPVIIWKDRPSPSSMIFECGRKSEWWSVPSWLPSSIPKHPPLYQYFCTVMYCVHTCTHCRHCTYNLSQWWDNLQTLSILTTLNTLTWTINQFLVKCRIVLIIWFYQPQVVQCMYQDTWMELVSAGKMQEPACVCPQHNMWLLIHCSINTGKCGLTDYSE